MKTIGAFEAKTHLSRLLEEVANGEEYVITRHGVPVARLIPSESDQRIDRSAAVEAMREFRKREKITLGDLSIREMIEAGRRF